MRIVTIHIDNKQLVYYIKIKGEKRMVKFETVNELTLKITADGSGNDFIFTKAGAFIAGENYGAKNYKFDKVLIGPEGNLLSGVMHQIGRRFTGENLPLMKVTCGGPCITYYANDQQHVVVMKLQPGEKISVESENILAFTPSCRYGVRFLAQGVISQKGLATSTLTGTDNQSYAAIIIDGNPIVLENESNGSTIEVDPDAVVCWSGADPGFKLDLSWKNLIGQASGESYMFEWSGERRAKIIIQPQERTSGVDISMDGKSTGSRPTQQQRVSARETSSDLGNTLQGIGRMLGGTGGGNMPGGMGGAGGTGGLGGLGGMLGL
jgi:uncharacterized protein (AIM24 family)